MGEWIDVATGEGVLRLLNCSARRADDACEGFLRGYPIVEGEVLAGGASDALNSRGWAIKSLERNWLWFGLPAP